ncbi:UPF0696 protein C11orf68 homolog isoform X2 [Lampris incognitus]|nr:UPF0696 protein C11orf68 homolog isoform X2 [Lampris incognitus]XP_056156585.1 UPF0696 protein C11orf68 homolog isoform X2 [Lampris incognitus]XP_056156586.1 UPF0696 protein C11orf68 homolog isoform X2 [Lampris incognitus]XP_056156587.1 UPF0696 protein C11orf68 homolog isoform X2 [Lampris incognitus]
MEEEVAAAAAAAAAAAETEDRDYAAEAMAADMDPWIVFDSRKTPRAEFDGWLESNRPSHVSRFSSGERGSVGWIAVFGPDHCPNVGDVGSLQENWERLLASGRPVNFENVKELALNHGVLSGKWLMILDSGFKLDRAWECVARATLDGKISLVKVSPQDLKTDGKQVICAYNQNFTDETEVVGLDTVIRATGVKCPLSYKPDVYSYLGIYRNNRWSLCPTIYESKFDLECIPRRSLIINKITNLEVT